MADRQVLGRISACIRKSPTALSTSLNNSWAGVWLEYWPGLQKRFLPCWF